MMRCKNLGVEIFLNSFFLCLKYTQAILTFYKHKEDACFMRITMKSFESTEHNTKYNANVAFHHLNETFFKK